MANSFKLYKLIILYMLDKVDFPLTNAQISEFILGMGYTTYFKLQHDQPVSTQMLVRICCALDCQLWDIADLVDKTDDV